MPKARDPIIARKSSLPRPLRQLRWFLVAITAVCCCQISPLEAIAADGERATSDVISYGIEGHYRVGRWTGIRASVPFDSVETRDGDGVQVDYGQPAPVNTNQWAYAIPGSQAAPMVLRNQGKTVASGRFPTIGSPSRGPAMIPLKMPWVVALGDPLGVDQIGANPLLNRDPMIAVSMPTETDGFPDSVLGYDGVDMMLIGAAAIDRLQSLSEKQRQAIADWITNGGRVFLTLGESASELIQAAPWLGELLPIDQFTTTKINPSALETFTASQTPLDSFLGAKLPKDQGNVLIMGRTTRRVSTPIAVDYVVGFGRITVVAADLEDELFSAWPERLDLITELTGTILIPELDEQRQITRATAYNDLAGQLRNTLDQFDIKRNFGFSLVSLILMALIAAIGPLDYLLVNRLLGRPLLGWISFPLMAIGLSVLLALQSRPVAQAGTSPQPTNSADTLQCNRIEVFDVDTVNGIGRGLAVSYLYGHEAYRFDADVSESESLKSISGGTERMLTSPFGYPGEAFGGIQIEIEDARLPVYQVPIDRGNATENGSLRASLKGLPLASRSSKGIATRCWFKPQLETEVSLIHRPGSELLRGELTNPLPLDLLDGMLIFRNWAYLLPTRFPAGGRIEDVSSLRQKNFRWQLSRQQALESATETEAWDPMMKGSPQRVTEMLMFHRAVGGTRYTGLRDDPLSSLDLSHVLTKDRCILVGRLASELSTVNTFGGTSNQSPTGDSLTILRVVLPVRDL